MEETGYEYGTLAEYASVARRFDSDFRKDILKDFGSDQNVSFAHFRRVMGLDGLTLVSERKFLINVYIRIYTFRSEVFKKLPL